MKTRLDFSSDFVSKGCASFVLCLTRDGDTEVVSTKEKGIATWFDAHVWTWVRSVLSYFRNTATISYKFEEILPALQRGRISSYTYIRNRILSGFNLQKYLVKHPQGRDEFFRILFGGGVGSHLPATEPALANIQTALIQFQQEIRRLGREFDATWPEDCRGSSRLRYVSMLDGLREFVRSLEANNSVCGGRFPFGNARPAGLNGRLLIGEMLLFREKELLLDRVFLNTEPSNRRLAEEFETIETEFGREKMEILRKWVADVEQCCRQVQAAIALALVNCSAQ